MTKSKKVKKHRNNFHFKPQILKFVRGTTVPVQGKCSVLGHWYKAPDHHY